MNDAQFTILAYAVGLTLLWGYALSLLVRLRRYRDADAP